MTDLSNLHALARPHPVRAPRGSALSCRNWLIEAAYRMIQNNLDPEVAENPDALVVYGGIGKAARNWDCFEAILEALRKLDQQFGRIDRARRFAPRPYEIVVLSDHGQTQGATFKQRNGYGLDDLVTRSLKQSDVTAIANGDEQSAMIGHAIGEATGSTAKRAKKQKKNDVSGKSVVVLGSGNLGLVYLMSSPNRLTLEEIEQQEPDVLPALRNHPHVGWVLVNSSVHGAVALGGEGTNYLDEGRVEGVDPLAPFSPTAGRHLVRTNGFANAADITIGSFYDPDLEEGCAFEELISFHGGLGGLQTRPFILHPRSLPVPDEPIYGAAAVHGILTGWRQQLAAIPS